MLRKLFNIRKELGKFLSVGALSYLISVGTYNALVHLESAPLSNKPLTASLVSGSLSILFAYFGNRYWTWKEREWSGIGREVVLFFLINIISLGINLLCLAFSRYVLKLESILADNIAANIVGVGIGTLFRFWSYRTHVFKIQ